LHISLTLHDVGQINSLVLAPSGLVYTEYTLIGSKKAVLLLNKLVMFYKKVRLKETIFDLQQKISIYKTMLCFLGILKVNFKQGKIVQNNLVSDWDFQNFKSNLTLTFLYF